MTETFYEVLGVAEDATTDEIEAAYRERLKETHPDVSDDEDAGQATKELVEARDVLVDEDERARYDRVGHAAYVGDSVADAAADVADSDTAETADSAGGPQQARDRRRRERAASKRVRQDGQARQDTARNPSETGERSDTSGTSTPSETSQTSQTDGATRSQSATAERTRAAGTRRPVDGMSTDSDSEGSTYSVRTEVPKSESFGPILPSGQRLTLTVIFFALYPVMLFSALLPAFPLVVNLIVLASAVVVIAYLQSMPRVALLVFGGWSAIGILAVVLSGIGLFSVVGFAIFCGTVLPFGFSLLTAWALQY
jgi:molecular chaperone DnaJ